MLLIGTKDLHLFLPGTSENAGPSARPNPSALRDDVQGARFPPAATRAQVELTTTS